MCFYEVSVFTVQLALKLVCANKLSNITEYKISCISFQLFYSTTHTQKDGQTTTLLQLLIFNMPKMSSYNYIHKELNIQVLATM